jgi:hypothetical protein
MSLDDAREQLELWRLDNYDACRSHTSLGDLAPSDYATTRQNKRTPEAAKKPIAGLLKTGPRTLR